MIKIYFREEKFKKGAEKLSHFYNFAVESSDINADLIITAEKGDRVKVERSGTLCHIVYDKDSRFFYALSLVLQNIADSNFTAVKTFVCEELGVMLDCSRNAIPTGDSLKRYIQSLALMGYTYLELYTEDTYEIEAEPLFGYQRGRYTVEEIKEIEAYCEILGIELVPCIQTLGHLNALFRHEEYMAIRDIDNIILLNNERTYQLIERMFQAVRSAFKTDRINLGMDEAHRLGHGRFLDENGYVPRGEIMKQHLGYLMTLCDKYGFKRPSMWNDMFFRIKYRKYWVNDDGDFSQEVIDSIPEQVMPIYWDYYTEDESMSKNMVRLSKQLSANCGYAGGVWKWSGFAPLNEKSNNANRLAIKNCIKSGIKDIMMTSWADNGAECSMFSVLASLLYVSQLCTRSDDNTKETETRAEYLFGYSFTDLMKADLPNSLYGEVYESNPSKYLLYNDVLLGLYDANCGDNFAALYKKAAEELRNLADKNTEFSYVFKTLAQLSKVLSVKCDLGIRLKRAYDGGDKRAMQAVADDIELLIPEVDKLYLVFREQWEKENKTFGFEVHDARLGGLVARLKNAARITERYLGGIIDRIEELESARLNSSYHAKRDIYFTSYLDNITTART